jgi:hypothetical protein
MASTYNKEEYAEEQKKKLAEAADIIQDAMEHYDAHPEDLADLMAFSSKFYRYSFRNQFLIKAQNPYASFVASYKSFEDMGYHVQRGQHGYKILVPVVTTYFFDAAADQWKQLKNATKKEKEQIRAGELTTKKYLNFKLGTVFDISQTDCPLEEYPKLLGVGYPSELHSALFQGVKEYSESIGIPVQVMPLESVVLHGYYTPDKHDITVNTLLDDTAKLYVMAHELGHALLHSDPKVREVKPSPLLEIEADAMAIMLETKLGLDVDDSQKEHLAGSYKEYCAYREQLPPEEAAELPEGVGAILEDVTKKYSEIIDELSVYLDRAVERTREVEAEKPSLEIPENTNNLESSPTPNEPYVVFTYSEHKDIPVAVPLSLYAADKMMQQLDQAAAEERAAAAANDSYAPYYKTSFQIFLDAENLYEGRQDIGDGDGNLISHIEKFWASHFALEEPMETEERQAEISRLCQYLRREADLQHLAEAQKEQFRLLDKAEKSGWQSLSEKESQSLFDLRREIHGLRATETPFHPKKSMELEK